MTTNPDTTKWLDALRGSLPVEGPGARGLEGLARNPQCTRLAVLTLAGVQPSTVMETVYGVRSSDGQSPFALARGDRFERRLLENNAQILTELFQSAARLPEKARISDISRLHPGTKADAMERRRNETSGMLRMIVDGDPSAPHLIVKPRLRVAVLDRTYDVEPDFLIISLSEPRITVGEIKSYPDRGGKTNPAKIRGACRQTAVGVVALRAALEAICTDPADLVPAMGDLVLSIPGSNKPTLRPMTLEGEVDSLIRTLSGLPARLDELVEAIPDGRTLDDRALLDAISNHYCTTCREHCALASVCRRSAREAQDPAVLGDRAKEQLAPVISLNRAMELMKGEGEEPVNDEETRLADRLWAANKSYREAVGHGW